MKKFRLDLSDNTWIGVQDITNHSWNIKNECNVKNGTCITFTTPVDTSLAKALQITAHFDEKIGNI